jgi:ferrous iron transport protein B
VLGRAVVSAIPAGLIIWIAANITVGGTSILSHCAEFLDPFASCLGLDGIILLAFILGLPANEIVIPIIIMAYSQCGTLNSISNLAVLRELFISNGWTMLTAVNVMLFSLFHWPCSTSLLTIKKETGSLKWMAFGFILPTIVGVILCLITTAIYNLCI